MLFKSTISLAIFYPLVFFSLTAFKIFLLATCTHQFDYDEPWCGFLFVTYARSSLNFFNMQIFCFISMKLIWKFLGHYLLKYIFLYPASFRNSNNSYLIAWSLMLSTVFYFFSVCFILDGFYSYDFKSIHLFSAVSHLPLTSSSTFFISDVIKQNYHRIQQFHFLGVCPE